MCSNTNDNTNDQSHRLPLLSTGVSGGFAKFVKSDKLEKKVPNYCEFQPIPTKANMTER